MTGPTSRRDVVKAIGTAGGLSLLAGCVRVERQRRSGSDGDAGGDDRLEPSTVTASDRPTPGSSTSVAASAAELTARFYARFVPRRPFGSGTTVPAATCADLARAERHAAAFGDTWRRYLWRWAVELPVPFPSGTEFVLSHPFGGALAGAFEQARAIDQLRAGPFAFDHRASRRGYELFDHGGSDRILAVADGILLDVVAVGRHVDERLSHLFDLVNGTADRQFTDDYAAVAAHLPLHVYTRLINGPALYRPGLPLRAAGQAVLFDGRHAPATSRTVLRYEPMTADPARRTRNVIRDESQLWRQPFHDPTVSVPADRTVVIDDRIDPEQAFSRH